MTVILDFISGTVTVIDDPASSPELAEAARKAASESAEATA